MAIAARFSAPAKSHFNAVKASDATLTFLRREFTQRRTFVHRDVVGLLAFELVLRIFRCRVDRVSFELDLRTNDANDFSRDASCFGVPTHTIADSEPVFLHVPILPA